MTRLNGAAFQKMYKIKGYWVDQDKKSYPLKAVCSLGASLDTIKAVYKLNPEAAFEALCECSFSKYPLEVVKFLVDSNPKALDQVDEAGRTVLHYSSTCNSVSKDVIKYIVSKNESRLLAKTTKGSTPLHLACGHLLSLKNLRHFVDSNGDVLKVKNNEGRTPLYIACCEKTPVEVIQYFTECCPLSLEMADMDGFLPLHGACCSAEPSMEIIEYLVTKNTRSLTMKAAEAGNGRTPLHLVAAQAGRSQLVKFLVDKNPSMLLVPDNDGLLPVHVACALADLETVKLLLNVRPDAMRLKSTDNLTPFTVACVSENMPVVTYMAEAFPDLMRLKGEEDGWYPLHHACSEGKTVVLDYLLEKYPDAALEVDRKGRSPLALIARRADCEIKIIQKLVGLHFDTIKILDYAGNPPLSHDQKDALIVSFLESRSPLS